MELDIELDKESARELWLQLADALRAQILSGKIGADKKLATQDQMMEQLQISRGTVTRAYDLLRSERLVVTVPGKGAYTAPAADVERARKAQR